MSCDKDKKPKDIPYYYRAHNITPTIGNRWYCVDNEWIWTVKGYEKEQCDAAEKKSDSQAFTPPTRDMYGAITHNGAHYIVWNDSKYGDYIVVNGENRILNPNWWTTHYKRTHGETQTKGSFDYPSKLGKGGGLPSMPSLPSLELPSVDVKLPGFGIGKSTKAIIGLVMFVFLVLLFLVALGYSGISPALVEEHKRRK